ncbi:hypothetical protein [Parasphingorhabdus cellanae]|uniref:Uncharacterized protein n=1 Tax=Parasphingorhabdus cellanae TaxID=2806553 RepID=A0ABX7T2L9_9SPHN|nr:hypothetical protein [Parasphingorhabdus cellanae]QTD55804.1 hypothetical protein J4G78_16695 [Parasphingorhabdus cellanae]
MQFLLFQPVLSKLKMLLQQLNVLHVPLKTLLAVPHVLLNVPLTQPVMPLLVLLAVLHVLLSVLLKLLATPLVLLQTQLPSKLSLFSIGKCIRKAV